MINFIHINVFSGLGKQNNADTSQNLSPTELI